MPTVDFIYDVLSTTPVKDVHHHNFFEDHAMPGDDAIVWPWCRSTLHRFVTRIGFAYADQVSHHDYTKTREDIVAMRDDYLE